MPSGNYRKFSLFQEWSACVKHESRPRADISGTARDSLTHCDQLCSRWSGQTFLIINIVTIIPGPTPKVVIAMKSLIATKTHAHTVSLNSDVGQVCMLETVFLWK